MRRLSLIVSILAMVFAPAPPQPIRRVEAWRILRLHECPSFARHPPQDRVDQRFEMARLVVGRRQTIGGVDGSVRRNVQEQKLAYPGIENLERRTRFVRRRRFGNEVAGNGLDLPQTTQCFGGDGAGKAGIARR